MIGDDEAPYGEAISEYGYEAGSGGGRCIVVLRDEAADGTRPKLFSSGQTARRTAPPAFSKSISTPLGQARASDSTKFGARRLMQASKPSSSTA